MSVFTEVLGWLVLLVAVVAVAALLCMACIYGVISVFDRMKERGEAKARRDIHRDLLTGSHWFSEHQPTSILFQEYANRIAQHNEKSFGDIREVWRKNMAKEQSKC